MLTCDADVQDEWDETQFDPSVVPAMKGGGGTNFAPVSALNRLLNAKAGDAVNPVAQNVLMPDLFAGRARRLAQGLPHQKQDAHRRTELHGCLCIP